jgi:hypothetical protein
MKSVTFFAFKTSVKFFLAKSSNFNDLDLMFRKFLSYSLRIFVSINTNKNK